MDRRVLVAALRAMYHTSRCSFVDYDGGAAPWGWPPAPASSHYPSSSPSSGVQAEEGGSSGTGSGGGAEGGTEAAEGGGGGGGRQDQQQQGTGTGVGAALGGGCIVAADAKSILETPQGELLASVLEGKPPFLFEFPRAPSRRTFTFIDPSVTIATIKQYLAQVVLEDVSVMQNLVLAINGVAIPKECSENGNLLIEVLKLLLLLKLPLVLPFQVIVLFEADCFFLERGVNQTLIPPPPQNPDGSAKHTVGSVLFALLTTAIPTPHPYKELQTCCWTKINSTKCQILPLVPLQPLALPPVESGSSYTPASFFSQLLSTPLSSHLDTPVPLPTCTTVSTAMATLSLTATTTTCLLPLLFSYLLSDSTISDFTSINLERGDTPDSLLSPVGLQIGGNFLSFRGLHPTTTMTDLGVVGGDIVHLRFVEPLLEPPAVAFTPERPITITLGFGTLHFPRHTLKILSENELLQKRGTSGDTQMLLQPIYIRPCQTLFGKELALYYCAAEREANYHIFSKSYKEISDSLSQQESIIYVQQATYECYRLTSSQTAESMLKFVQSPPSTSFVSSITKRVYLSSQSVLLQALKACASLPGISIKLDNNDMKSWLVDMQYNSKFPVFPLLDPHRAIVTLAVSFGFDFPDNKPGIRLLSPNLDFHKGYVNVFPDGSICMPMLSQWTRDTLLDTLLANLRVIIGYSAYSARRVTLNTESSAPASSSSKLFSSFRSNVPSDPPQPENSDRKFPTTAPLENVTPPDIPDTFGLLATKKPSDVVSFFKTILSKSSLSTPEQQALLSGVTDRALNNTPFHPVRCVMLVQAVKQVQSEEMVNQQAQINVLLAEKAILQEKMRALQEEYTRKCQHGCLSVNSAIASAAITVNAVLHGIATAFETEVVRLMDAHISRDLGHTSTIATHTVSLSPLTPQKSAAPSIIPQRSIAAMELTPPFPSLIIKEPPEYFCPETQRLMAKIGGMWVPLSEFHITKEGPAAFIPQFCEMVIESTRLTRDVCFDMRRLDKTLDIDCRPQQPLPLILPAPSTPSTSPNTSPCIRPVSPPLRNTSVSPSLHAATPNQITALKRDSKSTGWMMFGIKSATPRISPLDTPLSLWPTVYHGVCVGGWGRCSVVNDFTLLPGAGIVSTTQHHHTSVSHVSATADGAAIVVDAPLVVCSGLDDASQQIPATLVYGGSAANICTAYKVAFLVKVPPSSSPGANDPNSASSRRTARTTTTTNKEHRTSPLPSPTPKYPYPNHTDSDSTVRIPSSTPPQPTTTTGAAAAATGTSSLSQASSAPPTTTSSTPTALAPTTIPGPSASSITATTNNNNNNASSNANRELEWLIDNLSDGFLCKICIKAPSNLCF